MNKKENLTTRLDLNVNSNKNTQLKLRHFRKQMNVKFTSNEMNLYKQKTIPKLPPTLSFVERY